MRIRWTSTVLALMAGLSMGLANAQTPPTELATQGRTACEAVMTAQHMGAPEGSRQRHYALTAGVKTDSLCQCAGARYAKDMAATPAPDEGKVLERSLAACLPHFGAFPTNVQQAILAGPQSAQPLSPSQQKAETQMCRDMAQGRLKSPNLDMAYIRDWEKASGMQAADLCGACVVADMEDESAAARGEGLVWDARKRERMLVHALHNCQHWTYRMQARPQP